MYGQYYSPIKISGEPYLTILHMKYLKEFDFESVIGLPIFWGTECFYCLISNQWKIRNKSENFTLPCVSANIYNWVKMNII